MNLISQKLQIKKLNDRLLSQNILIQTLIDVVIDGGLVTSDEMEEKIEKNIEATNELLDSFNETDLPNLDESEVFAGLYYGPQGEA